MHPIIRSFIESEDTFQKIIYEFDGDLDPIVNGLGLFYKALNTFRRDPGKAILQAKTYPGIINEVLQFKDGDVDLFLLFLETWFVLCLRLGLKSDLDQIKNLIDSLIKKDTPKELIANYYGALGAYYRTKGRFSEGEYYSLQSWKILDSESFQYLRNIIYVSNVVDYKRIENDFKKALTGKREFYSCWLSIREFIFAVETGQCKMALKKLKEIPDDYFDKDSWANHISSYKSLLYKMIFSFDVGSLSKIEKKEAGLLISYTPNSFPYNSSYDSKFRLLDQLNQNNLEAAIKESKKIDPMEIDATCWGNGTLIRLELCKKKPLNARKLLENEISKGINNIWVDFYFFRILLLEGDHKGAGHYLRDFLKNVEIYNAYDRMYFEIKISNDLSKVDILKYLLPSFSFKEKKNDFKKSKPFDSIEGGKKKAEVYGLDRFFNFGRSSINFKNEVRKYASLDLPVLILGETGTGKDVCSRCIHEISSRSANPFIAVNCGAISDALLESELFGHVKGAFTGADIDRKGVFEEAGAGVVFLDEIGEISPRLQVSLLRVLENYEIKPVGSSKAKKIICRIIAATNCNLEEMVENGTFRSDLFYRLNRLVLKCLPLREKPEDISAMVRYFLNIGFEKVAEISPEVEEAFIEYSWPGNIRELKNSIERMRLLNGDKEYFELNDLEEKFLINRKEPESFIVSTTLNVDNESINKNKIPQTSQNKWEENADHIIKNSASSFRRLEMIQLIFEKYPTLTRKEIIEITKISQATVTKDLKKLVEMKIIEKVEPSRSPRSHYFQKL